MALGRFIAGPWKPSLLDPIEVRKPLLLVGVKEAVRCLRSLFSVDRMKAAASTLPGNQANDGAAKRIMASKTPGNLVPEGQGKFPSQVCPCHTKSGVDARSQAQKKH